MTNTTELIRRTAKATGIPQYMVKKILKAAIATIGDCLVEGDQVQLCHLGTLYTVDTAPRRRYDINTKECSYNQSNKILKVAISEGLQYRLRQLGNGSEADPQTPPEAAADDSNDFEDLPEEM